MIGSSDQEVLVDLVRDLSSTKETGLFLGSLVFPDWHFFWIEYYGWFNAEAIFASSTFKHLAFEFLLQSTKILDHPLDQPTPLLWSTETLP